MVPAHGPCFDRRTREDYAERGTQGNGAGAEDAGHRIPNNSLERSFLVGNPHTGMMTTHETTRLCGMVFVD